MGWFRGRELGGGGFEPPLIHRWLRPKISGNTINGVGETERRRPRQIYHATTKAPWNAVHVFFILRTMFPFRVFRQAGKVFALDKRKPAPVAPRQEKLSPEAWTSAIKDEARRLGFDQVGITRVTPDLVFEGFEVTQPFAIVLAKRMDHQRFDEPILRRDWATAGVAVLEAYYFGNDNARNLADWLRGAGWDAIGFGSMNTSALNLIPTAIRAGLGELGKHGSLINKELGSSFRLAYVLTDTPLIEDRPVDIGALDFCLRCKLCSKECPPLAISDTPLVVRGDKKWYVDFDKCVPYFNETYGCALCLAVCPWSRPGVGGGLSLKMLARRKGPPGV